MLNKIFLKDVIEASQNAQQRGYPAANISFYLGNLWNLAGNCRRAETLYRKTTKTPLDFTQSHRFLPPSTVPEKADKLENTR
jgi:hypothetical protein